MTPEDSRRVIGDIQVTGSWLIHLVVGWSRLVLRSEK